MTVSHRAQGVGCPAPVRRVRDAKHGPFTVATRNLADSIGEEPRNFQAVGWAGFKEYPGKPMIQDVNELAERTSRITGQTPDEVMARYRRVREDAAVRRRRGHAVGCSWAA